MAPKCRLINLQSEMISAMKFILIMWRSGMDGEDVESGGLVVGTTKLVILY